MFQVRAPGGLDQGQWWRCDRWLAIAYVGKVESTGCADGAHLGEVGVGMEMGEQG